MELAKENCGGPLDRAGDGKLRALCCKPTKLWHPVLTAGRMDPSSVGMDAGKKEMRGMRGMFGLGQPDSTHQRNVCVHAEKRTRPKRVLVAQRVNSAHL